MPIAQRLLRRNDVVTAVALVLTLAGCAARRPISRSPTPAGAARSANPALLRDATQIYEQMGLLAANGQFPFVGAVGYLAGSTPDTTLALLTLSIPTRAITFAREGDLYRGTYGVSADLRQGSTVVRHVEAEPVVRVRVYKETVRNDESVLFQQILSVPPGQYVLQLSLRDAGSAHNASEEMLLTVPRLASGTVGTPFVAYEGEPRTRLDSLPALISSPRATVTFGRDTSASIYLEAYGSGGDRVPLEARVLGEKNAVLWRDSLSLPRHGALYSGRVEIPIRRLGVGITSFHVRRLDTGDSARTPVFISFGDDLPVASFEQMLDYLRYFTTPDRIRALLATPPEGRAAAWAEFLRETDPFPATPQHEGLADYFARLTQATERYREEGMPGWLTDRGMVFIVLGDPDQIYETGNGDIAQRGRAQIWEYREHNLQLTFIDQTGFGRWRLTAPSENDFQLLERRLQKK